MVVLLLLILSGCGDCGSDSEAAKFARNLTESRLTKLFATVVSFDEDVNANWEKIDLHKNAEFSDLNLEGINYYPNDTSVLYFKTCGFDTKVVLFVDSVKGKIELRAGEKGKRELLWSQTK